MQKDTKTESIVGLVFLILYIFAIDRIAGFYFTEVVIVTSLGYLAVMLFAKRQWYFKALGTLLCGILLLLFFLPKRYKNQLPELILRNSTERVLYGLVVSSGILLLVFSMWLRIATLK